MFNDQRLLIIGLLLLMVIAPAAAQSDDEDLTIAYIGSSESDPAYQAALLALDEINDLRDDDELVGPDGSPYTLELQFYAANSDDDALDALDEAEDDEVLAVLVGQNSDHVQAILDEGAPAVPLFYADPAVDSIGGAYRLVADYETRAEVMADYLVNQRQITAIAISAADTETAQDARSAFITAAEADGAEIVADLTHEADADDLRDDAEEIHNAEADALFLWTLDAQALEMLRALEAEGWDGVIVYGELDDAFLQRADDALISGLLSPVDWSPVAYDADSQEYVSAYTARWDEPPSTRSASYYDALYLIAEGLREAGSGSTAFANALATLPAYDGVQGVYENATSADLLIAQVRDGGLLEQVRYSQGGCTRCPSYWLPDNSDSTVEATNLLIAYIAPMNDALEATSRNIEQALELAIRQINDLGGVLGADGARYTFTLRTYEAATQRDTAEAIQQALSDDAIAILGPDSAVQIIGNFPTTGRSGVPQIVSSSTPTLARDRDRLNFLYQMRPADTRLAESAASYLLDVLEQEDIATVSVRADYAELAQDAAEDIIADSDEGQLVLALEYDLGEDDFSSLVQRIVASDAQSLLLWAPTADAQVIVHGLAEQGWQGTVVYAYLTPRFLEGLELSNDMTLLGAVNWWHTAQDWGSQHFTADYQAAYGEAPLAQSAAYYDMVYLLAQGVAANGPDDLRAWIADVERFVGVQGVYRPERYSGVTMTQAALLLHIQPDLSLVEQARYDGTDCLTGCTAD